MKSKSSALAPHLKLHQLDAGKLAQVGVVFGQVLTYEVK